MAIAKNDGCVFDVSVPTINEHIKNIFDSDELEQSSIIRNFRIVQTEGNREVSRNINHYNLDAVIIAMHELFISLKKRIMGDTAFYWM